MARWHTLEILVTDQLADQEAVFAERLGVLRCSPPGERPTR
jgi:hypothetical protein